MKRIFLLALIFSISKTYGQAINDTAIKVVHENKATPHELPAYFLNGKFVGRLLATLDPQIIDSVYVIKGIVQIDGVQYNGQIHVRTKKDYLLKLISLNDLKNKYTNLKTKPTVFIIDGNIINADYDKYLIDENYVLNIIIDHITHDKENIDLRIVKLLTRTGENIKKSKEIRIKGRELAVN